MRNTLPKIKSVLPFFFLFLIVIFTQSLYAQNDARTLLENMEEEDLKNMDALAMYPKDTRIAILEATLHPEALIKIQRIQTKTKERFTDLIDQYPQETQQEIWDLTRYPNLIHRLLTDVNRNKHSVDKILDDYPKAIHKRAKSSLKNNYDLLEKVDGLNQTSEAAFEKILNSYEPVTQDALRHLVELPEVLTVLNENIEVTILVGDAYKNYPQWVLQKADSVHLELARENARELEDWKKRVEENPEVGEDLQASAKDFAEENGYDDLYYDSEEYDYADDDIYYNEDDRKSIVIEKHYHYNYPYWYGYPRWYSYPRWRPYPYWYDWGFHFRPGGSIIIIQMPSYYFVDWYFYRPHHHHHYPHLSAHFVDHYYGHRHSVGSISSSVHTWRNKNRAAISDEMISHAPRRLNEFKEFGKMESARIKFNEDNPRNPVAQKDFIEKNKREYPKLGTDISKNDKVRSKGDPKTSPPRTRVNPKYKFPDKKEKVTPRKNETRTPKSKTDINRTKKAKDYHKKTWQKPKQRTTTSRKKVIIKPSKKKSTRSTKPRKKN